MVLPCRWSLRLYSYEGAGSLLAKQIAIFETIVRLQKDLVLRLRRTWAGWVRQAGFTLQLGPFGLLDFSQAVKLC